jgi:hypothetical protein
VIAAITLRSYRVEPGAGRTIGVPYEVETTRITDATMLHTSARYCPLSSQNAAVAKSASSY